MIIDALLRQRIAKTDWSWALLDADQSIRICIINRVYTTLRHAKMQKYICKFSPRTAWDTCFGAVLAVVSIWTGSYTSARSRISKGTIGTYREAATSYIVSIVVRTGGANWHTKMSGTICIGIRRSRAASHTVPG